MRITNQFLRRMLPTVITSGGLSGLTQPTADLGAGANNGTAIDAQGWPTSILAVVQTGTIGGLVTAVDFKIQESVNGVSGFTDAIPNGSINAANTVFLLSVPRTKRFMRSVTTVSASGGATAQVTASLIGVPASPIAPDAVAIGLYTSIVENGLDTVFADLTTPTGNPGTQELLDSFAAAIRLPDGSFAADAAIQTWSPANAGEATTVAGWYLADVVGSPILLGWEPLPEPVALPDETASVSLRYRQLVDAFSRWGTAILVDG